MAYSAGNRDWRFTANKNLISHRWFIAPQDTMQPHNWRHSLNHTTSYDTSIYSHYKNAWTGTALYQYHKAKKLCLEDWRATFLFDLAMGSPALLAVLLEPMWRAASLGTAMGGAMPIILPCGWALCGTRTTSVPVETGLQGNVPMCTRLVKVEHVPAMTRQFRPIKSWRLKIWWGNETWKLPFFTRREVLKTALS